MDSKLKQVIKRWTHEFGFFTLGMFLGTCYGAFVATITTYAILTLGR